MYGFTMVNNAIPVTIKRPAAILKRYFFKKEYTHFTGAILYPQI